VKRQVIIELDGVRHQYGSELVLRDINLTINSGEIFGFLGHNGAGKTTAINILTTLIAPTGGTARVCGFDVVRQRAEVTRCIGYLPSEVRLYGHLTAAENLEFSPGSPESQSRAKLRWRPWSTSVAPIWRRAASDPSPAACVSASVSPRPCCTARACCFSTSPRRDWTRTGFGSCGRRSSGSTASSA